jgi:hypothetical protein
MADMREPRPSSTDPLAPPDAGAARAQREFAALARIVERHLAGGAWRHRHVHASAPEPHEAVHTVSALAGGRLPQEPDEEPVDDADITAALTLLPRLRGDLDALEHTLLATARHRGLTWQAIAFGLGLGSAQAAKQRYERLNGRADPVTAE